MELLHDGVQASQLKTVLKLYQLYILYHYFSYCIFIGIKTQINGNWITLPLKLFKKVRLRILIPVFIYSCTI